MWGKVGVSLEGSGFTTDGFPQVIANERGRVDTLAKVDYQNFALKVDYSPTPRVSVFGRGGYFREERDNAKITTIGPPTPGGQRHHVEDGERRRPGDAARLERPAGARLHRPSKPSTATSWRWPPARRRPRRRGSSAA